MPAPSTLDRLRAGPRWAHLSWLPAAPRRWTYALVAAVLAAGAPAGLVVLRSAMVGEFGLVTVRRIVQQDFSTFLYITMSTLAVFSAFGYLLGWQADALVDLSRTDPLTGLRNFRAFEERLGEEVARAGRYRTPLSLVIADVDGLKAINDRGGHHAGNLALRAVADALRRDARQTDLAARIGGDEFALIAPNTDPGEAFALGERLRGLVAAHGTGITISVGVATLGGEWPDASRLLQAGDGALYLAKRFGRNRVAAAETSAVG